MVSVIKYIYNSTDIKKDEIVEIISKISRKGGDFAMSTAIKLREEGKLDNAKKMFEKGFSIEDIIDITGLSKDELKKTGLLIRTKFCFRYRRNPY